MVAWIFIFNSGACLLAAGSWHCTDFRCYWGRFVFNERSWPHTPCASCNLDFWSLITCSNADLLLSPRLFSSAKLGRFAFLDPFNLDNLDASYQLRNGYYAIGSGGIFGNGLGGSIQKLGYLPEPHTDFIMTVIAEELGVFGVIWTIFLLMALSFTALYIAISSHFIFDSMVCIGVASWVSVQMFLNLGGVSGIIPLTGVPLPFISYGGSSVVMLSCAVGFVLAAARRNVLAKTREVVYL